MSKKDIAFLSTSYTSMKTYEDDNTSVFTWVEFTKEAGIAEQRAKDFLDLGWLQPINAASDGNLDKDINTENDKILLRQVDVFKARKANRLCVDFEIPSLAGAIIVDLLEKIDTLEVQLKEKNNINGVKK